MFFFLLGLGRHELTAEARGALLGEEVPKFPDPKRPSKDPITELLGRNVNFVSTNESGPTTNQGAESIPTNQEKVIDFAAVNKKTELDYISIKDTGNEIPKTFKPFKSWPEKQARYERYLQDKDSFLREEDSSMDALKEWERNRELAEFEQAAKLYRPLTGVMGDR
jgi:G patch domain-containing protein 1